MTAPQSSTRRILYLGTRALSLERIAEIVAARDLGYEIVMAADRPSDFRSYGCEHSIEVPLALYDEATEKILAYVEEQGLQIDGVIGWQDQEEELTSRLTEALGLPTCSLDANRYARDKSATRQLLDQLGGDYNPRHETVRDRESFEKALGRIGAPCVLKPSGNSGGRGIVMVDPAADTGALWQRFSELNSRGQGGLYTQYADEALLEEEVVGSEHSISGLVAGGEIYLLAITDKRIDPETRLQYENILPSVLPRATREEAREMARQIIAASGIDWRGFHIDFMVGDHGLRVLEIGARLGGECINSHLIPLASAGALRPYHLALEYLIQGRALPLPETDLTESFVRRAGSRVIAPPHPGTIRHLAGLEKACEHPNTRAFVQLKGVGDRMRPPTEAYEEYKVAYVVAESLLEDDLSQIFDDVASQVDMTLDG